LYVQIDRQQAGFRSGRRCGFEDLLDCERPEAKRAVRLLCDSVQRSLFPVGPITHRQDAHSHDVEPRFLGGVVGFNPRANCPDRNVVTVDWVTFQTYAMPTEINLTELAIRLRVCQQDVGIESFGVGNW
jgi:hypothetical protein